MKIIYLAGGCFWGVQRYFNELVGVLTTEVGYINGNIDEPSYEMIEKTNHAEAIKISYNDKLLSLEMLLEHFYKIIDPISMNKQGNDIGTQYRTGIYFVDKNDLIIIKASLEKLQLRYEKPLQIEVDSVHNYKKAEDYHQKYLKKNPSGYCHINFKPDNNLKSLLTEMEYHVMKENGTEPPFMGEYHDFFEKGIYVDKLSLEPLFLSNDKFVSSCGWPTFSKTIKNSVSEQKDLSHNMKRIEVRSLQSDSHLGHVFRDGPKKLGGLRYCINSAALLFIPIEEMEELGYKDFIKDLL